MGCGSSNTLDNSENKSLEQQERTLFNKTVANDAILLKEVKDYQTGVDNMETDNDIKEVLPI